MRSNTQAWDEIFRREGRVYLEPFARFPKVVSDFREHGCGRLLDLGCGSGRHVVQFAKEGFHVWGLDGSPNGLHLAREWLLEDGLSAGLVQSDMREPLPFPDCAFDGLLSTQVIHHALIAQVRGTIREIWRVLAPGGLAFVSVSGQKHDDEEYVEVEPGTWVPTTGPEAGLPHHIFSEEELRSEFAAFNILESSVRAEGRVVVVFAQKG
jgi:SAM-dependent methyltransferase